MKAHIASFLLACAAPAVAQCTIVAPGVQDPAPPVDGWSNIYSIGFPFSFNGTTYTDFYYSDHGLISFSNGGSPAAPPPGAQVWDPLPIPGSYGGGGFAGFGTDCVFAYWGDHTTGIGGAVYVDNASGNRCTITWIGNEPYFNYAAGAFTVQLSLYDDGRIVVQQDKRCNNTSSTFGPVDTIVGVWQDGSVIPASSDFNPGPTVAPGPTVFEQFTGPGPAFTNTPDPNYDLTATTIEFIPTNPGWLVTVAPLLCASTSTVGAGCGGLALTSMTLPTIGGSWDLSLAGGGLLDFIGLGFPSPPTPGNILAPGLFGPTCTIYTNAILGVVPAGTPATSIAIPLDPGAAGLPLVAQAVALFANPTMLTASNGERGNVGW